MTLEKSPRRNDGDLRLGLSLLIAVVIGAVFLYLASRAIPLEDVKDFLKHADWGRLAGASAIFMVLYSLSHGARIVRWYFLVRPLGEADSREVQKICTVGFTAILVVPFRLGEFVRPFLLARRAPISGAGALATVVVERVIDGLIITALLFVGLWTYQGEASIEAARWGGSVAAAIFVPALLMCILAMRRKETARWLVMATMGRISKKLATALASMLDQFVTGFGAMARGRDVVPFLGLTALYWATNVISMWVLLRVGFDVDVGLWEMVTVLAVLVVGIMVPAGPAMAGNFEYFVAHGMGLHVPLSDPVVAGQVGAFAVLLHLLQVIVIVVPGAWVMARHRGLRLTRKTLEESKNLDKTPL